MMNKKTCTYGTCKNPVFSKGRCKWHMERKPMKRTEFTTIRKPLRQQSKKRAKENSQYLQKIKEYKDAHPVCQVRTKICTYHSQEIHHTRGRENDRLLDSEYWLAVCSLCHRYIHANPSESYQNGWLISKN